MPNCSSFDSVPSHRLPAAAAATQGCGANKTSQRYLLTILLGLVIRRHREARYLTQEQVAEIAGCHTSYISAIENGRSELSIRIFDRLCKALAVSAHLLYAQAEILEQQYRQTLSGNGQSLDSGNPLAAQGWYWRQFN